jgi:flagellar assembly factor FliW
MIADRAADQAVTFGDGLPGFESCHEFVLVSSADLAPFTIVQGLGDDAPSFVAIDPRMVDPSYVMPLGTEDLRRLNARDASELLWFAIVASAAGRHTVNLRAPLVVNPQTMQGLQVLAADSPYLLDTPLEWT